MALLLRPWPARTADRAHLPVYPCGHAILRGVQLLVSAAVLGLDAYAVSVLRFAGDQLMLATGVVAIVAGVYFFAAAGVAPRACNAWVLLGLDALLAVLWLAAAAQLAAQIAPYMGAHTYCAYGTCFTYRPTGQVLAYVTMLAVLVGLGGLDCLLSCVILVIGGRALYVHRRRGLSCMPSRRPAAVVEETGAPISSCSSLSSDAEKAAATVAVLPLRPEETAPCGTASASRTLY